MLLRQVNRISCNQLVINQFIRFTHSEQKSWAKILYPLQSRSLLKISGKDASAFLQGLITNDMRHFEDGANSMYAMFLNNKGRVLYDTLLHRWEDDKSFMLECDKSIRKSLQNHLKIYKLKRLVKVEDLEQNFKIWALISPINIIPDSKIDPTKELNFYKDPRLTDLGMRIISSASLSELKVKEAIGEDITTEKDEKGYKYLRYKLGIGEGAEDLSPGTCFPLEVNCDYLHGVSFHKGCYIGQELTARIHHTGVVRKRIMPLKFPDKIVDNIEKDIAISTVKNSKANLGKLKGYMLDYGLGLVRIKEAMDAKILAVGNLTAEVVKPTWWPLEAPKEVTVLK